MAGSNGDLFIACQTLLNAAQEAVEATPGGPIEYACVSPGPPSYDIVPSIYVYPATSAEGDTLPLQPMLQPGHRIDIVGMVNLVAFTIVVLRPAPMIGDEAQTPTFPDADEITAAGEVSCADLWAIWNHLATQKREELIFPPKTREFWLEPSVAINQNGGACGWMINVRVGLDGYGAI